MTQKKISPTDLLCFNDYIGTYPLLVDLVYAQAAHENNMFKEAIYHENAKAWGHKDLVNLTLRAAEICHEKTGLFFEIKDCLRPLEAQQRILDTEIVQAHPQWVGQLLSRPGGVGGHPRGMAVDIILKDKEGNEIDMGTPFDYFAEDLEDNPADRSYFHSESIQNNRSILDDAMKQAAEEARQDLYLLPMEWWDFRFPHNYSGTFEPLSDNDLPEEIKMVSK